MSFDDLPAQPRMNEAGERYSAVALERSRAAAAETRCVLDIPYGPDYWQKLDVWLPPDAAGRDLPVLVFMHGGGWTRGYKEWCGFMAPALAARGIILVSVSYRLIPHVAFPVPVQDCIAALKWVADNIAAHGGSTERIFAGGHSAGGQLAALLALHGDWLEAAGVRGDIVRAVFCLSATFNRRMVDPEVAPNHVPPEPFEAVAPESPLALVDRARVPFYIAWGGNEHERLERTGRQMVAALEKRGVPVTSHVYPGYDHFDMHIELADPASHFMKTALAWMLAPQSGAGRT